ncbi:hypothetical protein [uncultured Streptomyces sp.]|uniref:hypothetical protein n=1 Tax=uncultured Streptomyces sp. TaxID=174707 RepID=UPI002613953C|nr:hypothetical protein [uncultured Streptomyces sp.]
MNPDNPVVRLCADGMRAESEGRDADARALFLEAWEAAEDDYDACVAAHYVARHQESPEDTLHWNEECLARADAVGDDRVRPFYASLHATVARAHLDLGRPEPARAHFESAATHLAGLPDGPYARWLGLCVARGLRTTGALGGGPADASVRALLRLLCASADLDALALLLPACRGGLGTLEDEERITEVLRMLRAERRLSGVEAAALDRALADRSATTAPDAAR